jgi:hypothetical protein
VVSKPEVVGIASEDGRLCVEFSWQGDRFAQRILLDGREVARSVEGDASQAWPPSPPLQQLSRELIQGVETILAVGAAGQTHFSLSAAIAPIGGETPSVRFDWASRCKAGSGLVQSTYRINDSIAVEVDQGEVQFGSAEGNPWRQVTIRPQSSDSQAPGKTMTSTWRWSYRVLSSE